MKKIIKSVVSIVMSAAIMVSSSTVAFGQINNSNSIYTIDVPYTLENVEKYENVKTSLAPDEIIEYEDNTILSNSDSNVFPNAVIIDPGTYRTTYSARTTNGVTYQDDTKSANALNIIKDVALTISGYFTSTVFNIVKDTASLVYGYMPSQISLTKPGSATLSHSYSYVNKRGQVYTSSSYWKTCVEIQRREWYRHSYTSFSSTDGYTRTANWDFIPSNGYSPIKTDYADYYFDDTTIKNIAMEVWAYNKPVVRYGWSF